MRRSVSLSSSGGGPVVHSAKLSADFLHQLLVLTSRPATPLDGLLQLVLEKALARTGSDVSGGLFVFELFGQEPRSVASALRGALADTSLEPAAGQTVRAGARFRPLQEYGGR